MPEATVAAGGSWDGTVDAVRLCMYRVGGATPRTGLLDASGAVHDLATLLESEGGSSERPEDLLAVIRDWAAVGRTVRAAMARVHNAEADAAVDGAALTVPFPRPRRDAFAIGGNYRQHVEAASQTTGLALTARKSPVFFMKPIGAFSGPADDIEYDASFTTRVDYEVELGVVIGKDGRDIAQPDAMDHVFGFLVVNDVSARDIMLRNKPQIDHFRGKGLDTFFPMGPGLVLRDDIADHRRLRLRTWVNGELKQDALAGQMTRDVPEIIAELSTSMSLYAGDIIATGTPSGVAQESADPVFLADGDLVETAIDGIGVLTNRVRRR